ncbi:hypothetical protein, partial [Streptomyces bambusae]
MSLELLHPRGGDAVVLGLKLGEPPLQPASRRPGRPRRAEDPGWERPDRRNRPRRALDADVTTRTMGDFAAG